MSSESPFFSVVIPTYNRAKILPQTLKCVLAQTFDDFEVVLIDNGSTDNSREVIAQQGSDKIRYFWQEGSGSPANPRNVGMTKAKGKWIALLDSDDWWFPHKLEKVHSAIQQNPQGAVFIHHELMSDEQTGKQEVLKHSREYEDLYQSLLIEGNFLSPSAIVFKKSLITQQTLKFNEDPGFATVEDYDLWLQFAVLKAQVCVVDEVLGKYIVNGGNLISNGNLYFASLKNLYEHHVFHVQSFEKNKQKLFKQLLSKAKRIQGIQNLKDKNFAAGVQHLIQSLFLDPVEALKYITQKIVTN
ncbi:glycosyltransferase family A protein [Deltaproteobacteria bacterium TL4]